MWDAMFMGLQSMGRDEHILSYILRVILQMLFNFTMGLFGAFIGYVWNLWSLIASYQPDPLTAIAFFGTAGVYTVCVRARGRNALVWHGLCVLVVLA